MVWCMMTWLLSLSFILFIAPTAAFCLCPPIHLVDPFEEVLRPYSLRCCYPHHVVPWVLPLSLTLGAEVIVLTHHALVPKSLDWLLTPITGDPRMQ